MTLSPQPNMTIRNLAPHLKIEMCVYWFICSNFILATDIYTMTPRLLWPLTLILVAVSVQQYWLYRQLSLPTHQVNEKIWQQQFTLNRFTYALVGGGFTAYVILIFGFNPTSMSALIGMLCLLTIGSLPLRSNTQLMTAYILMLTLPTILSMMIAEYHAGLILMTAVYSTTFLFYLSPYCPPFLKNKETDPLHNELLGYAPHQLSPERIEYLAYHDPLTCLPNRLKLRQILGLALNIARQNKQQLGVLMLDLDRFKNINDSLGHAIGDKLLCAVTQRLRQSIDPASILGREGGDEFIVVLTNIKNDDDITKTATQLIEILQVPFELGEHKLTCTASIGIAIYPDDGTSMDVLLQKADTAMYATKHRGRNQFGFYRNSMSASATTRLRIETGLRETLQSNGFKLHYQPQINLATKQLIGFEALLRWNDVTLGNMPPDFFIPVAEETGLVIPIGDWVLDEVCRQIVIWQENNVEYKRIAINLSTIQCVRENLCQSIRYALEQHNISPGMIELEITESALMHDIVSMQKTLAELRQLGIQVAIDDFGTGYSSLAYVKHFAVQKLKIDKAFIKGISQDQESRAIIKAIIDMASSINLTVLAEGIENIEQHDFLLEKGCQEGQGWLYAPALPPAKILDWIQAHNKQYGQALETKQN